MNICLAYWLQLFIYTRFVCYSTKLNKMFNGHSVCVLYAQTEKRKTQHERERERKKKNKSNKHLM